MASDAIATVVIVLDDNAPPVSIDEKFIGEWHNPTEGVELIRQLLERVNSGLQPGKVHVFLDKGDGTVAAGNVACTRANAAGDTVTIAGIVFTETTSPSSNPLDAQFARGASDTACAANLAAAINAHPALKGMLSAAGAVGDCVVTALDKGLFGNLIVMSTSDATAFGLTQFTSGAKGTVQAQFRTFRRGL